MLSCSIIVPIYNADKFLQKCIDSILSQSYRDFELILINDGSSDHSYEIAEKYQQEDKRVKLYSQVNSGIAAARQLGLQYSSGDWVMFVDADDYLLPNALQVMYDNAKDVDVVNASVIGTEGRLWEHGKIGVLSNDEYIKSILDSTTYSYAYAKLFRKAVVAHEDMELPPSFKIGEDVIMNLKIAKKIGKVRNIKDVVYCYRKNNESTMSSYSRSVLYHVRYFNMRNHFLSREHCLYSLPYDIKVLITAFYDDNIPYRHVYYREISNYLTKNNRRISDIPSLSNKWLSIIKKTVYYFRKQIKQIIFGEKRRIVID